MAEPSKIKPKENKPSEKTEKIKGLVLSYLYEYFNYLLILVVVVVLAVGFIFVIKPKKDKITDNIEKVNQEKIKQKEDLVNLLSKIKNYEIQYDKLDDTSKQRIGQLLPKKPDIENLFVQVEDMVRRRGLTMTTLKITESGGGNSTDRQSRGEVPAAADEMPARIGVLQISLSVTGLDYSSLKSFLTAIEANLRITDIKKISFPPTSESLELNMDTYYLKS